MNQGAEQKNEGLCSIEICSDGIAVAYTPKSSIPEIDYCGFYPYKNDAKLSNRAIKDCLTEIVTKHDLKQQLCNWVLHPSSYHLTLVNIPNVPQAEYKKAVRWQIKDIINYPLEDVAADIFYPDEDKRALKKIYVIAAQASFLQEMAAIIQDCELLPVAIDTREFAIRNLISRLTGIEDKTVGLLDITDTSCLMVLTKNNNVTFVRRIPIGLKNIKPEDCSELVMEIQRSFNYSLTELKQSPPTKLFVPPKQDSNKIIIQNIGTSLGKEISVLNLQEIINLKSPMDQQTEYKCWIALGGALRNTI